MTAYIGLICFIIGAVCGMGLWLLVDELEGKEDE